MKIKRIVAALLSSTMLFSLAACGGGGKKDDGVSAERLKTVKVWATGSDNVRQIFESLVKGFNQNPETKDQYQAELNFMLSGTGTQTMVDMLSAAYKANQTNTDYDLIDMGGDDLSRLTSLIGEEAFVKLDQAKIPNASRVSAKSAVAPDYSQPYRGTTVVLAYNSEKVANPPKTMDELYAWIKANPGRFAYNTPGTGGAGDSFVRTTVYNQISDPAAMISNDPKWAEQWDAGFKILEDLHASMYKSGDKIVYPNKNQGALDLLANGEIDMCPMWADMLLSQRAAGTVPAAVKMTTLTPSFTGSVQSMMIPKFGSNPDGAYAFVNYMLTDEAQELLVKQMAAIPLVDTSKMDMTGYEDILALDVTNFRTLSIGDLDVRFNERWDNEIGAKG